MRLSRPVAAVSFVFAAALAGAQSAAPAAAPASTHLVFPMHQHGSLALDVPAGWRFAIVQPERRLPATLGFVPREDTSAGDIRLTPSWSADGRDISSPEAIRASAETTVRHYNGSVENLKPLEGATGWYITLRDPVVTKRVDDFEYLTSVVASVGPLQVAATFLARAEDSPVRQAGFAVLRSLRSISEESTTIPVALAPPAGKWDLRLDVPADFVVAPRQYNADGSGVALEAGTREGWMLTAYVEGNPRGLSAASLRDRVTKGARESVKAIAAQAKGHEVKLVDLRTWEAGDRAMLAHGVAVDGKAMTRSRNVVFVHDGHWIDVHVSHSPPSEDDAAVFDAILKSVRVE